MTQGADFTETSPSSTPSVTLKDERLILMAITLGVVLAPLNSTMIAVALPTIMRDFDVGIGSAGWLVTAYLIAMASLQPLAGKFGDRFGHRRLVLTGLSIFGVVSVAAGLSPSLPYLLTFRVFQAVSAALIVPSSFALLRQILPEHRRGSGFGLMGAGIAIAAASGPPLGGILVEAAGWRAIFYVNVLVVAPALFLGIRRLPSVHMAISKPKLDLYGATLLPVLLVATAWIFIAFSKGADFWLLVLGIPLVVAGAILLGWYEKRQVDPIVQINFFLKKSFSAAAAGIGFANLAMYSLLISIPLLLANRSDSSLRIGLVLAVMSAGMTVSSFIGGRLIDRFGRRLPTTSGLVLLTVGIIPISFAGAEVALAPLILGLSLVGLGLGLATPGLQTSAVESVEQHQAGSASGLYSTSRYMGSIVGSAIIVGILGADKANIDALGTVFVVSLIAAFIASIASLGLTSHQPDRQVN